MGTLKLSQLEDEIRSNLGSRTDLDNRLVTFINWAQEQIARPRQGIRELKDLDSSVSTTADQETVTLPSGTRSVFSIRLMDGTSSRKLTFVPERKYDQWVASPTSYATAASSHYSPWGNTLYLWRVPDAAYTLKIRREIWPTALSDHDDTLDFVGLDECVCELATAKAFRSLKMHKEAKEHLAIAGLILRDYDRGYHSPHPDEEYKPEYSIGDSQLDYWVDPFVRRAP